MTLTITAGSNTITPTLMLMLSEESSGGNIVTTIPGRESPDVTLRPASLRSGTIELGFSGAGSDAASAAALNVLRTPAVFTVAGADRATLNMTFVVQQDGRIRREIERETRDAWTISVDYQEIAP